jgi:hypothetical protein
MPISFINTNNSGNISLINRNNSGNLNMSNSSVSIVTSGLVLNLDASNPSSYPGSGTTWTDLSGNGNNGTLTNGPTFNSANGGSIVFDGTNDFALINNPSTIRNQNFTVSVWINPGVQNEAIISIMDFDHSGSPLQGWVMQSEDATTNRNYYFGWYDGSSFQPTGGGGIGAGRGIQITTSIWQNLTYSKNGTTLLGYKNGIQTYTGTGGGNVFYQNNKNLHIAGCVNIVGRSFKGDIPNALIYNRALSATEILQNYNAQKSRFGL